MNLYETAMGQRFFNVQLPALINTLKDIAATLSRPAPSAISFPADPRFLTSLYYGEYEADVFKPDKRLTPFNQTVHTSFQSNQGTLYPKEKVETDSAERNGILAVDICMVLSGRCFIYSFAEHTCSIRSS